MSLATQAIDVEAVRRHFPALSLRIDGQPVVYLDNPAGTQVAQRVIDRLTEYWRTMNANQGGAFATSQRSDALLAETRTMAAAFLNARSPAEIVFGPNMTTITFAVSRAIGRELEPGDEIVVSRLEHDANVAPWVALADQGITVRVADIALPACTLDLESLKRQLTPRTRLVALTHASNAVGTIPPLRPVADLAHAAGAWFWVDAVHFGPHGAIDVQAIDCDFLVCSAYKFYGPHLGLMYGRQELLERLRPFKVRPASDQGPGRWETGTQNHEGLAGMLGAFEYLAGLSPDGNGTARAQLVAAMGRLAQYERFLVARLLEGLSRIPGVQIFGITDPARLGERAPTVSIAWPPHQPEAIARWLGQHQVFTTHGDHYAPGLMERLGLHERGGTLRIGLAHYNRASEVDLVLELLAGYRA
jgi:cysteine desulfurase family protein (TIGR01976 family)